METNIQIKTKAGRLLFELNKENNSIKDTVSEAVFRGIDLSEAYLRGYNLRRANLSGAKLSKADLVCADLNGADLSFANLGGANLKCADLIYTDFEGANLEKANLKEAYLCGAHLCGAHLCGANLKDTNIKNANLKGAHLEYAINVPFIPTYLPEGEFIAWKKLQNGLIVKLKILEDSKRIHTTSDKCRCDKCAVLEFQNIDGSKSAETEYTSYRFGVECKYKVGEIVEADEFDDDRWRECSHGIYFFVDRQSAVNYVNY